MTGEHDETAGNGEIGPVGAIGNFDEVASFDSVGGSWAGSDKKTTRKGVRKNFN